MVRRLANDPPYQLAQQLLEVLPNTRIQDFAGRTGNTVALAHIPGGEALPGINLRVRQQKLRDLLIDMTDAVDRALASYFARKTPAHGIDDRLQQFCGMGLHIFDTGNVQTLLAIEVV